MSAACTDLTIQPVFFVIIYKCQQQYGANPAKSWKNKDAAIYLVMSLAQKGSTAKHGTTQANKLVNLDEFFTAQILPELADSNSRFIFHNIKLFVGFALKLVQSL